MQSLTYQIDDRRTDEGGNTSHGLIQGQALSADDSGEDLRAVLEAGAVGSHDEHPTSQGQRQAGGGAQSWRETRDTVRRDLLQAAADFSLTYPLFIFGLP